MRSSLIQTSAGKTLSAKSAHPLSTVVGTLQL